MAHATFKGFIRISLVSVPVEGYSASSAGQSRVSLNQLHDKCHNRIRYVKTCPEHGEVTKDEIVMGYEFAKDEYAVIDPDELEALRSEADRSINVDRFVNPSEIDPTFYSGTTYYLTPQSKPGQKPYALLHRAMTDEKVVGVAQVVISNREQLVVLRPDGKLLVLSVLNYADHIKSLADFETKLEHGDVSPSELKLAKMLIDATKKPHADLDQYEDLYNKRLLELIQAKLAGRKVAHVPSTKAAPTINLMDALKRSLNYEKATRTGRKATPTKRPIPPTKKRRTG